MRGKYHRTSCKHCLAFFLRTLMNLQSHDIHLDADISWQIPAGFIHSQDRILIRTECSSSRKTKHQLWFIASGNLTELWKITISKR